MKGNSQPTNEASYSLRFEHMLMQYFGDAAYQTASSAQNPREVKRWLIKVVRKMMKNVTEIDTVTRHKEMLLLELEGLKKLLELKTQNINLIIFSLFSLCSRFLGYDYMKGGVYFTPFYYRSPGQYYTLKMLQGGDVMQDYHDRTEIIFKNRKKIIQDLNKQGLDDFMVSLILHTTEYEVKKLKKNL